MTADQPPDKVSCEDELNRLVRQGSEKVKNTLAVLMGALLSTTWGVPAVMAQPACVTQNMAVPAGGNTSDRAAPFFIDTTGLDFKTAPPTRDPSNPN